MFLPISGSIFSGASSATHIARGEVTSNCVASSRFLLAYLLVLCSSAGLLSELKNPQIQVSLSPHYELIVLLPPNC